MLVLLNCIEVNTMANMFLCAVRDRAIDAFSQPICVPALGLAVRSFKDAVSEQGSEYFKHPDDYDLYHVGMFDSSTGLVSPVSPPAMIAIGKEQVSSS